MATMTAPRRTPRTPVVPEATHRATRVVVGTLGALVGLAGVEHGVGEALQGPGRPAGLFIMSWPDAEALEVLSGEPAYRRRCRITTAGQVTAMLVDRAGNASFQALGPPTTGQSDELTTALGRI